MNVASINTFRVCTFIQIGTSTTTQIFHLQNKCAIVGIVTQFKFIFDQSTSWDVVNRRRKNKLNTMYTKVIPNTGALTGHPSKSVSIF